MQQNFSAESELAHLSEISRKTNNFIKRKAFLLNLTAPLQHLHSATQPAALPGFLHEPSLEIGERSQKPAVRELPCPEGTRTLIQQLSLDHRLIPGLCRSCIVSPFSHSPCVLGFLSSISFCKF